MQVSSSPVREARERLGLSLRQVGKAAGTTAGAVCRVERGTRVPSPQLAKRLCDVLALDFNTIYAGVSGSTITE